MANINRRAEILFGNNWVEVAFGSIKKGDIFRMFEPDGSPVRDRGTTKFIAKEDARYDEGWEAYMIDCDAYHE